MQPLSPAFIDQLSFNEAGLIPAIAQDWLDGAVLMVAWMNRDAIESTLRTGEVRTKSSRRGALAQGRHQRPHPDRARAALRLRSPMCCWSRSNRPAMWPATPAPAAASMNQAISAPRGPQSFRTTSDACTELFRVIEGRRDRPEQGSYTNKLLDAGDNRILKKIGEESAEFVMACKDDNADEIAGEAADILFHMQVALAHHGVSWRRVQEVLAARRGAPRRH